MQTKEEFQQNNPDLDAEVMALSAKLAAKGARLNVLLPGAPLPPAKGIDLLDVEPVPGEAASRQLMGSVRDAITALGGAAVILGLVPREWLDYLSGPQFTALLSAFGVVAVAGRRWWSSWEAQKAAKLAAQKSVVALTMEPVWQGKVMDAADVARVTKNRLEKAEVAINYRKRNNL